MTNDTGFIGTVALVVIVTAAMLGWNWVVAGIVIAALVWAS